MRNFLRKKNKGKKQEYMFNDDGDVDCEIDGKVEADFKDKIALMIAAAQIVFPVIILFVLLFGVAIFIFMNMFK